MHAAEDATQIFAQGMTSLKSDQLDEAINAFESVIEIEPNFVDAYYHLGLSYLS